MVTLIILRRYKCESMRHLDLTQRERERERCGTHSFGGVGRAWGEALHDSLSATSARRFLSLRQLAFHNDPKAQQTRLRCSRSAPPPLVADSSSSVGTTPPAALLLPALLLSLRKRSPSLSSLRSLVWSCSSLLLWSLEATVNSSQRNREEGAKQMHISSSSPFRYGLILNPPPNG